MVSNVTGLTKIAYDSFSKAITGNESAAMSVRNELRFTQPRPAMLSWHARV